MVPNFRFGRKATKHIRTLFDRFWLQAADWLTVNYVGFTPSTGLSGFGVARHAILATNEPNVRFLPIPSALPEAGTRD